MIIKAHPSPTSEFKPGLFYDLGVFNHRSWFSVCPPLFSETTGIFMTLSVFGAMCSRIGVWTSATISVHDCNDMSMGAARSHEKEGTKETYEANSKHSDLEARAGCFILWGGC